ncbi:MAG: DnaJ domain-containing protein [Candidatus Sigynarchaeota archaeon]
MSNEDYYKILGVDRDASLDEIKRSFKEKAKACHPDLHPGDVHAQECFILLNNAYDILSDARERRAYDAAIEKRRASVVGTRVQHDRCQKASHSTRVVHVYRGIRQNVASTWHFDPPFSPGFGTRVEAACPACRGQGISFSTGSRCPICRGTGWIGATAGDFPPW